MLFGILFLFFSISNLDNELAIINTGTTLKKNFINE